MNNYENELLRSQIEVNENWREWCNKIPILHFKPEWDVRIIPPFAGALVRFVIDCNGNHISVYFDGESKLGWMFDENDEPIPYWEIYPNEHGGISRYLISETTKMMEDIDKLLSI